MTFDGERGGTSGRGADTRPEDVALFVDPFWKHFERDRLFDSDGIRGGSDNALAPFVQLRDWFQTRGVDVHTADLL